MGLLLFLNRQLCANSAAIGRGAAGDPGGAAAFNAQAQGLRRPVARALILDDAPDAHSGEITDKGYINQALARARRAAEVERLFAAAPDAAVMDLVD